MISAFIAALTALLFGASPAISASVHSSYYVRTPTYQVAPSTPIPAPVASNGNMAMNWSGYDIAGSGFTGVTGSWTVPSPTAGGQSASDAAWIGIGGVTSTDLIQVGTQNVISPGGTATSSGFYEMLPDVSQPITNVNVHSGDTIKASIEQLTTGQWQIKIIDTTEGQSFSDTVSYASSASSAEWIEEEPSTQTGEVPLDGFGTVLFTGASATENGATVTPASGGAQAVTMVNQLGQILATPSPLGTNGASFSVVRSAINSITTTSVRGGIGRRRGTSIGRMGFRSGRQF